MKSTFVEECVYIEDFLDAAAHPAEVVKCCSHVGPPSTTFAQHENNIGLTPGD